MSWYVCCRGYFALVCKCFSVFQAKLGSMMADASRTLSRMTAASSSCSCTHSDVKYPTSVSMQARTQHSVSCTHALRTNKCQWHISLNLNTVQFRGRLCTRHVVHDFAQHLLAACMCVKCTQQKLLQVRSVIHVSYNGCRRALSR